MKFIDDAIKESEERMEEKAPKKISSDIDNDLIKLFKQNKTNIYLTWTSRPLENVYFN